MKRSSLFALLATLSFFVACSAAEPAKIDGIGPVGEIQKLHGDLEFTEGPVSDGRGGFYFTDIPANRIYKSDADGKLSVFLEPSGHTNGLMFDGKGRLLACQMDGQLVAVDVSTKSIETLAATYEGNRFNAPNDVVVDRSGGVYFTDPHFRAPEPLPQGKTAVYYVSNEGTVTRLLDDLAAPNGVILSPDEKTLYVIPSMQKEMMAYPIEAPGKLGEGQVFCNLQQLTDDGNRGGDGLTVDTKGNLYITSQQGIQVFSPKAQLLGIIEFPEQPANVTFAGPKHQTLIVTARNSVYAVEMEATGHQFPGK